VGGNLDGRLVALARLGLVRVGIRERLGFVEQTELIRRDPLTRAPEALVAEQAHGLDQVLDLDPECLDLLVACIDLFVLAKSERAQRFEIFGQLDCDTRHTKKCSVLVFFYKTES
jgi:hypothetical protein